MKKRIIAVILALVFVLCLVPATASAATVTGDGYTFDTVTGELTVTTNAGTTAWRKNTAIAKADVKSLTIGDVVDTIGDNAFLECTGLVSVTIPNNVKTIGSWAFSGCTGITSLELGDGVETIGDQAFRVCSGLKTVIIPGNVITIRSSAFSGCTGITSLTIEDGVKTIGSSVFYKCTGLTTVTIPDSVETIGNSAFLGCKGITSFTIGDGVKSIGYQAFYECTGLTTFTIPSNVKFIDESAFLRCTGITSFTIGDGVESIGIYAFQDCAKLINIASKAMTAPTIDVKTFLRIPADAVLYIPGSATGYDAEGWPKNVVKIWTVSGTVFDENGSPVADATVDINGYNATTTDENGAYSIFMAAQNGSYTVYAEKSGYMLGHRSITVADADITDADITMNALSAPAISGPTAMTLTEGYAATSSKKFTITGAPTPYVTATGNDSITWNDDTQCLDIAAGLPIGTYEVTLTANNVFLPDALDGSKIKVLNVPAPEIEPATHVFTLTVKAPDPVIVEYTLTFETNGGSGIDPVKGKENSVIDLSSYKTTRSGYSFSGWYSDEALKNKVTNVTLTADTTVYAGWSKAENPDIPETGDFFSGILLPMTALALLLGVAIAMLKVRMLSLRERAK